MDFVDLTPPEPSDVPRDGYDRPMIVPRGGGLPTPYARASSFADAIEDKSALGDWQKRMVILGAAMKPSLLNELDEIVDPTDPECKRKLTQRAESAIAKAGAHEKSQRGTRYHELTEFVDRGERLPPVTIDELADMQAYMLATVHMKMLRAEQFVVCHDIKAAGTFDRLAEYDGPGPDGEPFKATVIADLKTGRVDYGGIKMPVQLAIYAHSELYDPSVLPAPRRTVDPKRWEKWKKQVVYREEIEPAYADLNVNRDWGLIINLIPGSNECKLYWADLQLGWEAAQLAATVREMRSRRSQGLREWVPLSASSAKV